MSSFLLFAQDQQPLAPNPTASCSADVLRIGDFLIGDDNYSNLGGHPDIRY